MCPKEIDKKASALDLMTQEQAMKIAYPLYECYTSERKYNDRIKHLHQILAQDRSDNYIEQLRLLHTIIFISDCYLSELDTIFIRRTFGISHNEKSIYSVVDQTTTSDDCRELVIDDLIEIMPILKKLAEDLQTYRKDIVHYINNYHIFSKENSEYSDLLSEPFQRLMRYTMTFAEIEKNLVKALGEDHLLLKDFSRILRDLEKKVSFIDLMQHDSVLSAQQCHSRTVEQSFKRTAALLDKERYDITVPPKKRGIDRAIVVDMKDSQDSSLATFHIEKNKGKKRLFKKRDVSYGIKLVQNKEGIEPSVLKSALEDLKGVTLLATKSKKREYNEHFKQVKSVIPEPRRISEESSRDSDVDSVQESASITLPNSPLDSLSDKIAYQIREELTDEVFLIHNAPVFCEYTEGGLQVTSMGKDDQSVSSHIEISESDTGVDLTITGYQQPFLIDSAQRAYQSCGLEIEEVEIHFGDEFFDLEPQFTVSEVSQVVSFLESIEKVLSLKESLGCDVIYHLDGRSLDITKLKDKVSQVSGVQYDVDKAFSSLEQLVAVGTDATYVGSKRTRLS